MKASEFTVSQKRALAVFTIIALLFGAYFLRGFFILIVVAGIMAFLFTPLYKRFGRRFNTGLSATFTFLSALLMLIAPLVGIVILAVIQVSSLVGSAADWMQTADLSALGVRFIDFLNDIIASVPYVNYEITPDSLTGWITSLAQNVGNWLLGFLSSSASSVFGALTSSIIFIYAFISLLINQEKLTNLFKQLNPTGPKMAQMYLDKMAAMVKGSVNGQFIIALCQGVTGALSIYIAGFHEAFFVFAIFFTLMSMIPLGSGIITIPFGIGMMLFGNIPGGLFVVLWHILGVTNIDNILRPILIPRSARLDPALMLISVFAGISMFGFWGIIIGPVLMILITTTIKVYLAVYKGVPLDEPDDTPRFRKKWLLFGPKVAVKS